MAVSEIESILQTSHLETGDLLQIYRETLDKLQTDLITRDALILRLTRENRSLAQGFQALHQQVTALGATPQTEPVAEGELDFTPSANGSKTETEVLS